MPSTIEKLHGKFKSQGLVIWAVNIQELRAHVAEWVRQKGVTSRVLLDTDGSVTRAYRVTGTPTVLLIDRAGRLVGRAVGSRGWETERGRALISALLAAPRP